MKIFFLLCICLLTLSSYGQQLQSSEPIFLDLKAGVIISEINYSNNHIIAVGHIRKGKNLQAYLAKFTKEGEILIERSFGDSLSFDRATSIISKANNYWVLLNQAIGYNKNIKLLEFDENLEILNSIDLSSSKRTDALKLKKLTENELAILFNYDQEQGVYYPMVLKYNLFSGEQSSFLFHQNNRTKIPENYAFLYGAAGEAFQDTSKLLIKVPNNIDIVDGQIIAVGSEDSGNFQDHWAGCIDENNQLRWDHFFEKERDPGVDVLVNAMEASKGQIALVGQHYNKRGQLDYNYNYLLVDSLGKLQVEMKYSLGFDEIIVGGQKFGEYYLLFGYVNEEPDKKNWIGENIVNVNIWFVLVNEKGDIISEEYIQSKGFQTLLSSAKMDDKQLVSIFKQTSSDEDGYYVMVTELR